MENQVILNNNAVKNNKLLKKIQKEDKKNHKNRKIDKNILLNKNIEKVVYMSSNNPIGDLKSDEEMDEIEISDVISVKKFISLLEKNKLTGMSGNGFQVSEKIKAFDEAQAEEKVIIINGAECEPSLIHDDWLMDYKSDKVLRGIELLSRILNIKKIFLATRGNKNFDIITSMRYVTHIKLPYKYPMGEKYFLIEKILDKKIPHDIVPEKEGILVLNVQTVYQIYRIISGNYDGGRFVTLANLDTGKARIGYVTEDISINEMLDKAFGEKKENEINYSGGGILFAHEAEVDEKFKSSVCFAARESTMFVNNDNECKECGNCTKKCPMGVDVKSIVLARQKDKNSDISMYNPDKCIKCATCTFYCKAGKNIASYISGNL